MAQVALLAGVALQDQKPLTNAQKRAERADVGGPFPLDLRSPQVVSGTSARVLVALRRPSLAELDATREQPAEDQRAYVRSLHREARALMSALDAKGVRFGQPVLFARVWSGFAATIATKDLPAVQTLGLRVEPVARFFPAQVAAREAPEVRPLPTKAKPTRRVAVLDAFERGPFAADEVDGHAGGPPTPDDVAGDQVAGVVRDELPGIAIARMRVAASQPLETGKFQVFSTTDQLLSGLERVVDPDQDGDASDAVPVAVTGLSAPYSGFENSAIAEAIDAAVALGTLVVVPAGNGGDPDGPFGSIGAPGAARMALTVGALDSDGDVAQGSSRGPTFSLGPKPDLAIGGGAESSGGIGWGTAMAAARVAGVAAALRAERPRLTAEEAAAALVGTAAPRGEPDAAGGGDPLLQAARVTPFVAIPAQIAIRPGQTATVRIVALSGSAPHVRPKPAKGLEIAVAGANLRIHAAKDAEGSGRIDLGQIAIPYQVVASKPPAPPLGEPQVIMRKGRAAGVRFTAGSIDRGDKGTSVLPVGNLVLILSGPTKRELTPPGGARDLLPGEYAYTLTDEITSELEKGRYRFELRARGTAGGKTVVRRSPSFKVS